MWAAAALALGCASLAGPASAQAGGDPLVALRTNFDNFLVADPGGNVQAGARAALKTGLTWVVVEDATLNRVSFKSNFGKYLVAEPDGKVRADRDELDDWERFELIDNGDGTISLRSFHGKFLVAEPDGSVKADRHVNQAWEQFRKEAPSNEAKISIKSFDWQYVVAEPDGQMFANRGEKREWETFSVSRISSGAGDTLTMRSVHGEFVYYNSRVGRVRADGDERPNTNLVWQEVPDSDGTVRLYEDFPGDRLFKIPNGDLAAGFPGDQPLWGQWFVEPPPAAAGLARLDALPSGGELLARLAPGSGKARTGAGCALLLGAAAAAAVLGGLAVLRRRRAERPGPGSAADLDGLLAEASAAEEAE